MYSIILDLVFQASVNLDNLLKPRDINVHMYIVTQCPSKRVSFCCDDGTGIHTALKMLCPSGIEGSNPSRSTKT